LFDGSFLSLTGKPTTLTGYGITDGMSTAHVANGITAGNITNWNTAFGWGDHAGLYRPVSYVPAWNEITSNPFNFGTPTNNQLLKFNATSGKWEGWSPDFLTSYTETDPVFGAWDKSSGIVISSTQVNDFATGVANTPAVLTNTAKNSYPIEDAAKLAGIAAGAEVNINADWNATEGDAQLLNKPILATVATTGNYNDLNNKPTGTNPGDMLYWNGTQWVNIPASTTNGLALTFCNGAPHWGPCLDFATLTTTSVTAITGYTAVSGGNVTNTGGSTITERGVCLATNIEPDIYDITFACSGTTGSFSANLSGLAPTTTYYIRAYATNSFGTAYGNELEFTTLSVPTVTTTDVTSITPFTAISGGNVTDDGGSTVSRGVCYGTSVYPTISNYTVASGTGTGSYISILQNLTPVTVYYLRAYATNSGGTAYGNQVEFTTPAWTCGNPVTVVHDITEGVAPVNKIASYGTVTNIPGETTKCWITSNLGADNQATAVSDATEASAGWYWQFNRKQGYKYATSRVPNTTWMSSINENLGWTSSNDPCALEMENGWRIPTYTEWANVDASGSWNNWTGPWNSDLKLHAAGLLNSSDGSLSSRGSVGRYWSSTQNGTTTGWDLYSSSSETFITYNDKALGYTLRCLRD
jgi:hypothetical protein